MERGVGGSIETGIEGGIGMEVGMGMGSGLARKSFPPPCTGCTWR